MMLKGNNHLNEEISSEEKRIQDRQSLAYEGSSNKAGRSVHLDLNRNQTLKSLDRDREVLSHDFKDCHLDKIAVKCERG